MSKFTSVALAIGLGFVVYLFFFQQTLSSKCEKAGGVLLRSNSGYVCMKKEGKVDV